MLAQSQDAVRNRLLKVMPAKSFALIQPHLEPVDLPLKMVLVLPHTETTHVHFIENGLASIVATSGEDDEHIEVGHIGWEGMSGSHLVLASPDSSNHTFMQAAGAGLRMEASAFLDAMDEDPHIRRLLLRYVHSYEIQLAQSALANGRYTIRGRLARWILMCHDRIEGDDLPLTHEFLALMLGVRRSGVTDEIHIVEGTGLIKATRGNIQMLNREKLEELAGGCYGVAEREYKRLIDGANDFSAEGTSMHSALHGAALEVGCLP